MSGETTPRAAQGWFRSAVSLVWIVAVSAAFCVVFATALMDTVRAAAERFPLLERILDWLTMGA